MDFIEEMLDKLRGLIDKLLDALLGPEPEVEPELIPVPVNDRYRRR